MTAIRRSTSASAVTFEPTGTISATDVQAAIAEVASEGGGGTADTIGYHALASGPSAGAFSIDVDRAPTAAARFFVVIDPYTIQCETRLVTFVSGTTLSFNNALLYSHTTGDAVLIVTGDCVTPGMYGAVGDNSVDDAAALQAAINDIGAYGQGLAIDGQQQAYKISQPLPCYANIVLRNMTIRARAGYAPADSTNAMLMSMQGTVTAFTATASNDQISAPLSTITTNGMAVVFKGSSLPGGITAGRRYFVVNFTSSSNFKISLTLAGAAVDISSDGGGSIYSEVISQNRLFLDNVLISGASIAGINGVALCIQQPQAINKLRVQFCPGYGAYVLGQQGHFINSIFVSNGIGLVLFEAQFMYFFNTNSELNADANIQFRGDDTNGPTGLVDALGNKANAFYGLHLEGTTPTATKWIDYRSGINNMFSCVSASMVAGGTFFDVPSGSTNTGYVLDTVIFQSTSVTDTTTIAISDPTRDGGTPLYTGVDFRNSIDRFSTTPNPGSESFPDYLSWVKAGGAGRRFVLGGTLNAPHTVMLRPGTTQTGDQIQAQTSAGVKASGLDKGAYIYTMLNAAPADAALAAGQAMFWFDSTNGAAKLMVKAKQADGSVKTGSVTLS